MKYKVIYFVILFVCATYFIPAAHAQILFNVPFTSQAPFGNWAEPYQSFCEEAVVVMAAHFVWGYPVSRKLADMEMKIIKLYEKAAWGYYKDTSVNETAQILKNLYDLKHITIKEIKNIEEIKKELIAGNIVLVPVAGKMLRNPYFISPAPLYHMVLIKGFDDMGGVFVTNEPGTRYGNGYKYQQSILFNAIHDWNNGDVMHGKKMVIMVGK